MSEVIKSLLNLDDAGATLVSAKLTAVYNGLLESLAVMPECVKLFPVLGTGESGHTAVEYGQYEEIGKAKIVNNNATDIPAADIGRVNRTNVLAQVANYFRFSTMELENAVRTGSPLSKGKHYAALLAQAAEIDRIFFAGDASFGITGLADFPLPTLALPTDGTGSSATWESKDAAQIARDMRAACRAIADRTNGTRSANTLILSGQAAEIAATKNINGKSALTLFRETMPSVNIVESVAMKRLGGKDVLAMDKAESTAGVWMPSFGHLHPEQRDGLALKTIVESRTAGLVVVDSRAIVTATGVV